MRLFFTCPDRHLLFLRDIISLYLGPYLYFFPTLYLFSMVHTRSQDYAQAPQSEIQDNTPVENLAERRSRWSHLLRQQHYLPVISEVLDGELPKYENSVAIDATDRVSLLRECSLILASAPAVFAAAVDGNLMTRMSNDADLQREYAVVQERAHYQPSIYIHLLADERGVAPSPNQYLAVRDMVLDYLAEGQVSEHAWHLDNITPPAVSRVASAQGHRKYLHTNSRLPNRVEVLRHYCDGVQKRWLETPAALRDTPFRFPPGECGYSIHSHFRLSQHRAHRSSNYVMNLAEDICTYLHRTGRLEQHFRMHQFIIYLIFRPSQAAIAEILCSGLLQVWVGNGGGFNAHPAGRSVASARRLSDGEWDGHERWIKQRWPVDENISMQRSRADEWRTALDWEPATEEDEEMTE